MKRKLSLVFILMVGILLVAYPTIGNLYNMFHQTRLVESYNEAVEDMTAKSKEKMWQEARAYNKTLGKKPLAVCEDEKYQEMLNVNGAGMMGYVEVPSCNIKLTIYHGTSDGVLRVGAGHIAGTSLPVGGKGSHSCISAHTGLPSARLFTDIRKMKEGDVFIITVLDKKLYYKVDKISVVLPSETDVLQRNENRDYCTLMTCTPYGVNTHRLMVRGVRTKPEPVRTKPSYALLYGISGLLLVILILLLRRRYAKN